MKSYFIVFQGELHSESIIWSEVISCQNHAQAVKIGALKERVYEGYGFIGDHKVNPVIPEPSDV